MTAERVVGAWRGCVLTIETGVAVVLTDVGQVRASYDGRMLSRVARDPQLAPRPGDWVELRAWPDHRVTISSCLTARPRSVPQTPLPRQGAVVLPMRRA